MINYDKNPKVIISASGMCNAGRIRHHLKHNLYNPKCSIVFVGYQAAGTLGRILLDGAEKVKLFGETIAVRAQIYDLEGFSAHADRDALYTWLSGFTKKPREIYLVHGDPDAKKAFAEYVKEHCGWDCNVVEGISEYELGEGHVISAMSTASAGKPQGQADVADEAMKEFTSQAELDSLRQRLGDIHHAFDKVLSEATDAVDGDSSAAKLTKIKNIVAALENDVINLGSAVTEEDRSGGEDLHLSGDPDQAD